ncbi:MAG: UDP-3-O-(3-hydroxymyristoyl)glucosamine N-acyltransferase [Planctomycetota bacterium]|nr:MAG: UDP-3-O-(3-hydroxymyristoyl)glucosamine N-acyltransferase [Planctomycetota bacterium]
MDGLTVEQLARELGAELRGDGQRIVRDVQAIEQAGPTDLTFVSGTANAQRLAETRAAAALVDASVLQALPPDCPCALLIVEDAQARFIELLCRFRPPVTLRHRGVSPEAFVHPTARLGSDCTVFPGAYIGARVVIGDRCEIHPGAVIEDECLLGDDVVIFANAVLYPRVRVGNRVRIHAGTVIGADGFGYRFENGRYVKIPHVGGVVIEDDVEIGAGTTVDAGMIGPTVIGEGTKIDDQVMIAHNCRIGRHNAFASQVGFAGSVTTGDYVRCAGQAGVADHLHLGDGCVLGPKAGVHKNVPDGAVYHGIPARPQREQLQIVTAGLRLPEMRKTIRTLQAQVQQLQDALLRLTPIDADPPPSATPHRAMARNDASGTADAA